MSAAQGQGTTLLAELTSQLQVIGTSTPDGTEPPAAILWTDPKEHWRSLAPALLESIPELLIYGEYKPETRTGPAIWLRCIIDGGLEIPEIPAGTVPIIYLPGVARQDLRAGEECPDALKPLVELMYRGQLWHQKSGNDWTATAFLKGLELDLNGSDQTTEALLGALHIFASEPIDKYKNRRLEATHFQSMLNPDPVRDFLRWLDNADGTRETMGDDRWAAFCNQCKQQFGFDPENDSDVIAGQNLGKAEGEWATLWQRFEDSPQNFPGIPSLLRRSKPNELIFDPSRWPDENDSKEEAVRTALGGLADLPPGEACDKILEIEKEHRSRLAWVWSRLSLSPMAKVLVPLAELATYARSAIGGQSPDDIARTYTEKGWKADHASWQAVITALEMNSEDDKLLIYRVVQQIIEPWLQDSARAFQDSLDNSPLPDHSNADLVTVPEGGCLLFADGLRYDLGEALRGRLESRGCKVTLKSRWAAIPTVTATAKPAVTPISSTVCGNELPDNFEAKMRDTDRAADANSLREGLREAGYQVLKYSMIIDPESGTARGWEEYGKIDTRGHQLQAEFPSILEAELDKLAARIVSLLDAGWNMVRVVTDHGWLYLPLELPKVDLPRHLTVSKWARVATIAGNSQVDVPTASWHWNPVEHFATGTGIACFKKGVCYSHGGLSIQECLTPDLHIERSENTREWGSIEAVTWKGLRCFVSTADCGESTQADLRLQTPSGDSVTTIKTLDEDGTTSLVLKDDEYETADLVVVLLSSNGKILAQHKTKVGIDS